jgi:hypothetical protein
MQEMWRKMGQGSQMCCNSTTQCLARGLESVGTRISRGPHNISNNSKFEQLFMALSETAASGVDGPRTLEIRGHIQNLEILILIDSGSNHSFLSDQCASNLAGVTKAINTTLLKVTNGNVIPSLEMIQAYWAIQG